MLHFDKVALFDNHMIYFSTMNAHFRYYPVTPAQKQWGLYVTCVGHHTTPPGAVFPSPDHPDEYYFTWKAGRILHEWQIILIDRGEGDLEFRNERLRVGVGSLIILPPGSWHRYRPDPRTGWTTRWIGFGGDLADRLIGAGGLSKGGSVKSLDRNGAEAQLFVKTVSDLLAAAIRTPFSAAARIPLLAASVLESSNVKPDSEPLQSPILTAQMYITDHQSETIDFEKLARTTGLSYRSFRYLFARETGTSPLRYQLERRLIRAKNLLASSDMPVKDIAETLGFSSTWYFSHFFKKRIHQSPAAYRANNRSS